MLISVIINCFNGSQFLSRAIESVLVQSFEQFELIVFDNCSTDGSPEIVRRYQDKRIRLISSNEQNVIPLYAARNAAVDHTSGEIVCFLDCDDLMLPERLSLIANTFSDDCVHWMCTSYLKYAEQNRQLSTHKQKSVHGDVDVETLVDSYNVGILTCAYRKEIFDVLHFNPEFNIVGDYVFNVLCAAYYQGVFLDIATAVYFEHGQNISLTQKEHWSAELNALAELLMSVRSVGYVPRWVGRLARRSRMLAYYLESVGTPKTSLMLLRPLSLLLIYSPALFARALVVRFAPNKILNKLKKST